MDDKYKYRAKFNAIAKVVIPSEKDAYLAKASLDKLKGLLPNEFNPDDNEDLLFISGNAAVAGLANLNDDVISTQTAVNITPKFKYKFIDVEHLRTQIAGAIFTYGFTKYGSNDILTQEEALALNEPFNMAIGGFIWKTANPDLTELLIESSDESSPNYASISFSWEILFSDYAIAMGNKVLAHSVQINDPEKVEEYSKLLRSSGGVGTTDSGQKLYRIIQGDAIPVGVGLTQTPAADVKGLYIEHEVPKMIEEIVEEKVNSSLDISEEDLQIVKNIITNYKEQTDFLVTRQDDDKKENIKKNISQVNIQTVKNNSIMKITKLEDITDENLKECSSAAVKQFVGEQIAEKINEVSVTYADQLKVKEEELKTKEEEAKKIAENLLNVQKELDAVAQQLKEEKAIREAEKAQADFNIRMSDLESKFELGEKELSVVAKHIKGLDETSYAGWLTDFETLYSARKKDVKKEDAEDNKDAKEAKASAEDVLDDAKEEDKATPPNTPSLEKSVKEEFAEAFKLEDFEISVKK